MPDESPIEPTGNPSETLASIIQEFALFAARREEGIQNIQNGQPVDLDCFAGPSVLLLNAAPGLGKTYALIREAERLWKSLPVLQLGPTHDSFDNVERIAPDEAPDGVGWGHWQGHNDGRKGGAACPKSVRASMGYKSGLECTCEATPPSFTGVPTFAPVDYVLNIEQSGHPLDPEQLLFPSPLTPHATKFPWWAIDDVGLDRFVGKREVTKLDLDRTSAGYPDAWVGSVIIRQLTAGLSRLLERHTSWMTEETSRENNSWSGYDLYQRLDDILREQNSGVYLPASLNGLEPSNDPWPNVDAGSLADWPQNFMPYLVPKLESESAAWFNATQSEPNQEFQPHIHVVWESPEAGGPLQSVLRIRWRRRLSLLRPILIMDASGNLDLLERAFRGYGLHIQQSAPVEVPPFPTTMKVRQYWGHHLTKGTLSSSGSVDGTDHSSVISSTYRNLLIQQISRRQEQSAAPLKVGIVSFKSLVDDGKAALVEAGIAGENIVSDYYFNVRGSNSFTKCDIVIIVGYPIPNPQGLYEEACALYDHDMPHISREREYFAREMELRNGQKLNIEKIPGYADERLQALYEQKSLSEVYQAFHRARPYALSTSVKEVLMFTDVPVEGVPVDGFFCEGRHGRAFDILTRLFDEGDGEVAAPELAGAIQEANPEREPSLNAVKGWVRKPATVQWLTKAIGCEFIEGNSKTNPHKYRRISGSS